MRYLKLVIAPAIEPVDLATAKDHLNVDFTDRDAYIQNLIVTARQHVERETERALITQTWDMVFDMFPASSQTCIELAQTPLQSVTSVTYTDSSGASTVWPSTNYVVDDVTEPPRLMPAYGQTWPIATLRPLAGVAIRMVVGYGVTAAAVPWPLKQAMLLLIGHWYLNREATAGASNLPRSVEFAVDALLGTYRPRAVA